jgi:hypothetical protein
VPLQTLKPYVIFYDPGGARVPREKKKISYVPPHAAQLRSSQHARTRLATDRFGDISTRGMYARGGGCCGVGVGVSCTAGIAFVRQTPARKVMPMLMWCAHPASPPNCRH